MGVDQLVDESGRLDLVEVADALAEALDGEVLDGVLFEVVLGDDAWPWLLARDVAARLVDVDGRVRTTPAWDASGFEVSE